MDMEKKVIDGISCRCYNEDRKGATDRRLVQKFNYKKVTATLEGGGYFFVFVFSIIFNNNVTTILSIISTMDKSSKSLIRIPSFLRFPMYIGFHRIQRESSLCSMEGLTAYRIYGSTFRISILGKCRIIKRKVEKL